jgi:hypothetical protein
MDASSQGGSGGRDGAADTGSTADGPGAAAPTWDSFAKGFFTTYCVSCHNDDNRGDATRDYHVLANVVREKAIIACGVSKAGAPRRTGCGASPAAAQFPVGSGPKPTDAERDRIVQWIDSGTP